MTPPTATSAPATGAAAEADDTPSVDTSEPTTGPDVDAVPADDDVVAEDLLVEEVSIDGMCGVY